MGKGSYSDEVKRDAVARISERGCPVAEVAQRLGVSQHSLYAWKLMFAKASSGEAEKEAEIRRLKRELTRVTEERDILRKGEACPPLVRATMAMAFVAGHRGQFPVRALCRCRCLLAPKAEGQGADPLGPGQPVHQHGLGRMPESPRSRAFDEPPRDLSRQRARLLSSNQWRTRSRRSASSTCSSASGSGAGPARPARKHGGRCSTTSRCSTTRSESTRGTRCCHPSSSNGSGN